MMNCRCHDLYCTHIKKAEVCERPKIELIGASRDCLFKYLEHGDLEHRLWLRKAIDSFFAGLPRPEVR